MSEIFRCQMILMIVAIIFVVSIELYYYFRGVRDEKYRILRIIEQTFAGRRQTTEKIKFMIDFKEELKRRIAE